MVLLVVWGLGVGIDDVVVVDEGLCEVGVGGCVVEVLVVGC